MLCTNKIILLLSLLFCNHFFTQSKFSKNDMRENVQLFNASKSNTNFLKLEKEFERIANFEKNDWLPFYYAAMCNVLVALKKNNQTVVEYCSRADYYCSKADSLSKNNSEIYVLKSMIAAARLLSAKPNQRQKYGTLAAKFANEAIKLDDKNPRAYLLKGRTILNTPETFGGGSKKAKPIFEKALEKFKIFNPETSFHPNWGQNEILEELSKL